MRRQIDHVTVRVRDHQAAESFYGAALRALGWAGHGFLITIPRSIPDCGGEGYSGRTPAPRACMTWVESRDPPRRLCDGCR
jgi:catechol 2,3-dioxygenase-like lactoylglutathione lyase family enzyme